MATLNRALRESDPALLPVLARVWGVDADAMLDSGEMIDALAKAMLDPERVERVWATLEDRERGALFLLVGSRKMSLSRFAPLFGPIRPLSPAQIERERPDKQPAGPAEALYYKGFILKGFENAGAGPVQNVFIPDDLLKVLPLHKTQYEHLDEEPDDLPDEDDEDEADEEGGAVTVEPVTQVANVRAADTSAVDDLTTLLSYLQRAVPTLDLDPRLEQLSDPMLSARDRTALEPFLLTPGEERLTFLLGLGLSAGLVEVQGGRAKPDPAAVSWLKATRAEQVRILAEAWRESGVYRELWHVPGLTLEPGGRLDSYDAAAVRSVVLGYMAELAPAGEWWTVDSLIQTIKEREPDFQRRGSQYDNLYIMDRDGAYLTGVESWDTVEGALLEFYVLGPLHWLGLMDAGDDAARLTAYGRAFLQRAAWPAPKEPNDRIVAREDGTLLVSRKVSRFERFQASRFTTLVQAGDPYTYRFDWNGIREGQKQGINTARIMTFLTNALGEGGVPAPMAKLLEKLGAPPLGSVSLEQHVVLRVSSADILRRIINEPALNQHLGAQLGDLDVLVRADRVEALRDALHEQGYQVDVD